MNWEEFKEVVLALAFMLQPDPWMPRHKKLQWLLDAVQVRAEEEGIEEGRPGAGGSRKIGRVTREIEAHVTRARRSASENCCAEDRCRAKIVVQCMRDRQAHCGNFRFPG